ncbi:MFS transporter, partial [bacterium]|nr:MFS transporter [bacterium]
MIDSNELKRGFQQIIKDGICSQIMVTLTGGIFLTGLALELGASNFVVGILAAIPPVMQLVQIPSIYLVERLRTRKPMVAYAAGISRIFLLIM